MPKRPVVNLPTSMMEHIFDVLSFVVIIATVLVVYLNWQKLPDQIPVHFNIHGAVDKQGPKATLIFLIAMSVANFLLLTILRRYPHTFNYLKPVTEENAAAQYSLARKFVSAAKFETSLILLYAIWCCVQTGLTGADSINIAVLFAILGVSIFSGIVYFAAARRAA